MIATLGRNPQILKVLLEKEADIRMKGKNGQTALGIAEKKGYIDLIELLKRYG